jgi:hypothetical protein
VALDIANALGREIRHCQGGANAFSLTADARRGEADLARAVIVDAIAFDDRIDGVAVRDRVGQPLDQHDAGAGAEHSAGRARVEWPAVAVARGNAAILIEIATLLRQGNRYPTGQRHVALKGRQALASLRYCKQRGRTGALHGYCRPAQIELISHASGDEIVQRTEQL